MELTILILLGISFTALAYLIFKNKSLLLAFGNYKWEEVEAKVLKSELKEKFSLFGVKLQKLYVLYSYKINGTTFLGSAVGLGRNGYVRAKNNGNIYQKIHQDFQQGTQKTIYVHSNDPTMATLKKELPAIFYQDMILIAILAIVVIFLGLFFFQNYTDLLVACATSTKG